MDTTSKRKGKDDPKCKDETKGKGFGKKEKKSGKTIGNPEGEEWERTGRKFFPGPATLPEPWRERKPDEVIVSGTISENPGNHGVQAGSNGIPVFRRAWVVADAPPRMTRVLDNQVGDPRLWDPYNEDFWSVCQPVESEEEAQDKYRSLTPPEGDIHPPPQKGRKGSARGSSVPPGSDTAKAEE